MPPLRFKSVCTETGREFWPQNKDLSTIQSDWLVREDKTWHSWPISVLIPNEVKKPQICQSTGLTDIKKNDLYFNDAIYYCGVIYYLEWSEGQIMLIPMEAHQLPEFALDLIESGVMCGTVIGNRWMPFDELKARAEAVYPKQNQ